MPKVLLVDPINDMGTTILKNAGLTVIKKEDCSEAEFERSISEAWGVIVRTSKVTKDMIESAPSLSIIGRHGAGVDNIDVEFATRKRIAVVNTPDANTAPVAEYVIGSILTLAKGFVMCDNSMKKGEWKFRDSYKPLEVAGTTLGLIGYGRIGRNVAVKALALGLNVIVFDPYIEEHSDLKKDEPKPSFYRQMKEVIKASDFLSLHIPYSKDNAGLIDFDKIKLMKDTSYLINASRGGVVVENDLYRALDEGVIAGAAVDVFESEPPPENHLFFKLNNIILTPHNAALTQNAMIRAASTVAQELVAHYQGDELANLVNPMVIRS